MDIYGSYESYEVIKRSPQVQIFAKYLLGCLFNRIEIAKEKTGVLTLTEYEHIRVCLKALHIELGLPYEHV